MSDYREHAEWMVRSGQFGGTVDEYLRMNAHMVTPTADTPTPRPDDVDGVVADLLTTMLVRMGADLGQHLDPEDVDVVSLREKFLNDLASQGLEIVERVGK